ncbi:unnamed protein product [Strongylus vulgaris]|uniref:Uncharacterized protein n=1 Tax=Strongylus vulgaris TaxID=40348 RepID=A0A3P7L1V0_STRVU|nr:unnamed protein product [Strongylus vulgaris]
MCHTRQKPVDEKMRNLLLLIMVISTVSAFTVLPYIQIDYAHYFRLAQCQAKCTQKYGVLSDRTLLDGSVEEFLDTSNEDCKAVSCAYMQFTNFLDFLYEGFILV